MKRPLSRKEAETIEAALNELAHLVQDDDGNLPEPAGTLFSKAHRAVVRFCLPNASVNPAAAKHA